MVVVPAGGRDAEQRGSGIEIPIEMIPIHGRPAAGDANNCGHQFHLPVGYNGRASSVVVSRTDVIRPRGQGHPTGNSTPYFGPSQKLDFELEMASIVGPGNELGKPIDINDAEEHIFGLALMNDWSARDIQAWETIPLGPFLGKSFSTTISPWIVTLDALKPFTCDCCEAPKQEPEPLAYLAEKNHINYDIPLEVWIKPKDQSDASIVSKTNFKHFRGNRWSSFSSRLC